MIFSISCEARWFALALRCKHRRLGCEGATRLLVICSRNRNQTRNIQSERQHAEEDAVLIKLHRLCASGDFSQTFSTLPAYLRAQEVMILVAVLCMFRC